ncbi:MAG: shikimate kinase [Pseudomonadota bacterium]
MKRSVVLVGMMGAGKTAVGKRLARRLGADFIDADSEIEAAAGCSVSDFFARHGEPAFREGERKVIARLLRRPPCVIATGGGAFVDVETRAAVKAGAVSVWLRADLDTLARRTAKRDTRPLLREGDPRATLKRLMDERHPSYAEADIVIDTDDGPTEDTATAVEAALRAHHAGAAAAQ